MNGRPPRSPLFPYTTLFRSQVARGRRGRPYPRDGMGGAEEEQPETRHVGHEPGDRPQQRARIEPRVDATAPDEHDVDRKSTRLNSSHANISYAVFCLKKKHI